MRWISFMLIAGLLVCVGCSGSHSPAQKAMHVDADANRTITAAPGPTRTSSRTAAEPVGKPAAEFVALQDEQGPPNAKQPAKANLPRKIRYTANAKLIVEEFAAAEKGLKAAIKEADADIAQAEVNISPDAIRTGIWKIRVPVKNFDSFREALFALGEVEQNRVDSEDMTAEYHDLEAYIENRTKEEVAMNKLLEKAGERDMDIFIKIKRERDEIRRDINIKEGRRRLVANLTDLTTVNLTIRERQKHDKATTPVVTPPPATFGTRASETFSGSWQSFVGFLQALALVVLAVIPWLPLPLLFMGLPALSSG